MLVATSAVVALIAWSYLFVPSPAPGSETRWVAFPVFRDASAAAAFERSLQLLPQRLGLGATNRATGGAGFY